MTRTTEWTPDAQLFAVHAWTTVHGSHPRSDEWRHASHVDHPRYGRIPTPGLRTVQTTWPWTEFLRMYDVSRRAWSIALRDVWTLEEIDYLDWEDVGFWLPIDALCALFTQWIAEGGGRADIAFPCAALWTWAEHAGYAAVTDTAIGDHVWETSDLTAEQQRYIATERECVVGLPPRVLGIRWPLDDGAFVESQIVRPQRVLSASACQRIARRCAEAGIASVSTTPLETIVAHRAASFPNCRLPIEETPPARLEDDSSDRWQDGFLEVRAGPRTAYIFMDDRIGREYRRQATKMAPHVIHRSANRSIRVPTRVEATLRGTGA